LGAKNAPNFAQDDGDYYTFLINFVCPLTATVTYAGVGGLADAQPANLTASTSSSRRIVIEFAAD